MGKHKKTDDDLKFDEAMKSLDHISKQAAKETRQMVRAYNKLYGIRESRPWRKKDTTVGGADRQRKCRKKKEGKGLYQICLWTPREGFNPLIHKHLPVRIHKKNLDYLVINIKAKTLVDKFLELLQSQTEKANISPEFYSDISGIFNIFRGC